MLSEEEKWKLKVVLGNKRRKKKRLEGELETAIAEIKDLRCKLDGDMAEGDKWKLKLTWTNKGRKRIRLETELAAVNVEISGLKQKLEEE